MLILEYLFYVLLYGYVIFGFVYFIDKGISFLSIVYSKEEEKGIPSIDLVEKKALSNLEEIFKEIDIQEIEEDK
jgi:hypothetical protein